MAAVDAMNVMHPNYGQNYRLTRAALRLGTFTVSELEGLTEAPRNTVYAFVSQLQKAGDELVTFEELQSLRGRPQKRYRLTDAGTKHLMDLSFEQASRLGERAEVAQVAQVARPQFYGGSYAAGTLLPASDIYEQDEELIVQVEVPGMSEQDIDVRIEAEGLIVSGERPAVIAQSGATPYVVERQHGRFTRTYPLPQSGEARIRRVAVQNGLLEVILEKAASARSEESDSESRARRATAAAFHHFRETAGS